MKGKYEAYDVRSSSIKVSGITRAFFICVFKCKIKLIQLNILTNHRSLNQLKGTIEYRRQNLIINLFLTLLTGKIRDDWRRLIWLSRIMPKIINYVSEKWLEGRFILILVCQTLNVRSIEFGIDSVGNKCFLF